MNYLYFCLSFAFCAAVCCITFLFCVRVLFLTKSEKLDPVHVIHTPKKINAAKRIDREEKMRIMLENG